MSPEDPGARDLFASRELRVVLAATLAAVAVAALALVAARDRTDLLYDDLGRWELSASGTEVRSLRRLQPSGPQRPFRLVLALDRTARAGESAVAERSYRVDPAARYCFELFVTAQETDPDSAEALEAFRTGVTINGSPAAWFPLAERRRSGRVRIAGIEPAAGHVDVRLEVRRLAAPEGPAPRIAARVAFEFARLYRCEDSGGRAVR